MKQPATAIVETVTVISLSASILNIVRLSVAAVLNGQLEGEIHRIVIELRANLA